MFLCILWIALVNWPWGGWSLEASICIWSVSILGDHLSYAWNLKWGGARQSFGTEPFPVRSVTLSPCSYCRLSYIVGHLAGVWDLLIIVEKTPPTSSAQKVSEVKCPLWRWRRRRRETHGSEELGFLRQWSQWCFCLLSKLNLILSILKLYEFII